MTEGLSRIWGSYAAYERDVLPSIIPTFFVRFEDLITRQAETLIDVFRFLLNAPSIEGTVIEHRIKEMASKGKDGQPTVYALKKPQDKKNLMKNGKAYSAAQMKVIKENLRQELLFLGYTNSPNPADEKHETEFFHYDDLTEEDNKMYRHFEKLNENVLVRLGSEELMNKEYVINAETPDIGDVTYLYKLTAANNTMMR